MERTLPSVNPVFRNLTLNVSIAFATMQVSNWRMAASSSSVKNNALGIRVISLEMQYSSSSSIERC
jgi:hypothetical protein